MNVHAPVLAQQFATEFDFDAMHSAIAELRDMDLVFIGGSPKSGTTWLQLLLNAHADVCCRGEAHASPHSGGIMLDGKESDSAGRLAN
jgi:hypothetical protein